MKKKEKDLAHIMRKEGKSIGNIAQKIGVSKSSVSLWVRDVVLTEKQRKTLNSNGFSVDAIEKRRISRIENTKKHHNKIFNLAKKDVNNLSQRDLWLIGTALYWGEGGKTVKSLVRLSNSDPIVIQIMMRFFKEVCSVPSAKFRGHVHTFSHLNTQIAEKYWSRISGIPQKRFFKTYAKPSKASLHKKDSLPYGTFQIYVCDTELFLTIMGWIEGVHESIIKK